MAWFDSAGYLHRHVACMRALAHPINGWAGPPRSSWYSSMAARGYRCSPAAHARRPDRCAVSTEHLHDIALDIFGESAEAVFGSSRHNSFAEGGDEIMNSNRGAQKQEIATTEDFVLQLSVFVERLASFCSQDRGNSVLPGLYVVATRFLDSVRQVAQYEDPRKMREQWAGMYTGHSIVSSVFLFGDWPVAALCAACHSLPLLPRPHPPPCTQHTHLYA